MATLAMSNSLPNDHISCLPVELKIGIIRQLHIKDRISLRTMSRKFNDICLAEGLFEDGTFTLRPHFDDMERLLLISTSRGMAMGIRQLKFLVGDMSLPRFEMAIDHWRGLGPGSSKEGEIAEILNNLKMHNYRHCNQRSLERTIPYLPSLVSIFATSAYPFNGCGVDLESSWQRMTTHYHGDWPDQRFDTIFQDNEMSSRRYTAILLASSKAKSKIQKLVLDPLPIDCFCVENLNDAADTLTELSDDTEEQVHDSMPVDPDRLNSLMAAVSGVQTLRIRLFGTSAVYQDEELAEAVGKFLGSMPRLRSLDLTNGIERYSLWRYSLQFISSFFANTWPFLESLRLNHVGAGPHQVVAFLRKHKSTLRYLSLGHHSVYIGHSGFSVPPAWRNQHDKKLLTIVRNELSLKSFEYVSWRASDDAVRKDEFLYNESWESLLQPALRDHQAEENGTTNEAIRFKQKLLEMKTTKLLEMYVLGNSDWPMEDDAPSKIDGQYLTWETLPDVELRAGFTDLSDLDADFFDVVADPEEEDT